MSRRIRQHIPGLMFTGLVTVVAMVAMNNQNNLMFWVFGALTAGLLLSAMASNLMIHSLRARRIDPQHGSVGEPLIVRYAVTNRSRVFSAFSIHLQEVLGGHSRKARRDARHDPAFKNAAWLMHIGPRETVHGEAIFWPQRRGRIAFQHLRIWTTFPFGIIRKSKFISQPQHTLIYPMMYQLRPGLLRALAPKDVLGAKISHHAGAGDDFYGTREYRQGDSMRHIHWRQTARLDQLITIERTNPSPARMRVILDLIPSKKHTAPNEIQLHRELEEKAISLAASMVRAADLNGYEIGLTVLGVQHPPIALRRNQWHFHKIMAALASLNLEGPRQPFIESKGRGAIRDAERAVLVVIAPDRIQPLPGSANREDVMYFSARHLEEITTGPLIANLTRPSEGARSMNALKDQSTGSAKPSLMHEATA